MRIPPCEAEYPFVLGLMTDGSGQFILLYPSSVHRGGLPKVTATQGGVTPSLRKCAHIPDLL